MNDIGRAAFAALVTLATAQSAGADPTRSFYADRRAYQAGDVLTVVVAEAASVSARARTETNKKENATGSVLHADGDLNKGAVDFDTSFAGGGQIDRSGRLLATLAVTVDHLDPLGNLAVTGEQVIVLNNEEQHIKLSGLVRPEDIGPDNTVPSTRIGSARIELTGNGLLARKQRPGLISRILTLFGW